jgi:hypothetical protein
MARGFLVGENLKDKIKSTIAKVDGMIPPTNITRVETRPGGGVPTGGQPAILAAYPRTVYWQRGSAVTVTMYAVATGATSVSGTNVSLVTMSVQNSAVAKTAVAINVCDDIWPKYVNTAMMTSVGVTTIGATATITQPDRYGPTPTMTWCIVGKARGGHRILVETERQPVFRICAFTGTWHKGDSRKILTKDAAISAWAGGATTADQLLEVENPFKTVYAGNPPGATCAVVRETPGGQWFLIAAEC